MTAEEAIVDIRRAMLLDDDTPNERVAKLVAHWANQMERPTCRGLVIIEARPCQIHPEERGSVVVADARDMKVRDAVYTDRATAEAFRSLLSKWR